MKVISPVALALALAACSSPPPAAKPAAPPVAVPTAATGRVETMTWHSAALGVDKQVVVYLPAGYDAEPGRRWPVFYYLNGLGGDETNWVKVGHLDAAADALKLAAILVMPDGDNNFYVDSAMPSDHAACMKDGTGLFIPTQSRKSTCVRASKYETYIAKDLVAWTDATFRTKAERGSRAIAGLSMGGFGALELAMRHPDTFAAAASHSGVDALLYAGPHPYAAADVKLVEDVSSWGRAVGPMGDWIRALFGPDIAFWREHDPAALAQQLAPGQLAIYLDCGTEDDFLLNDSARYLHDVLVARKIDHAFFLGPGRHNFAFWSQRAPASLAFLRDHTR